MDVVGGVRHERVSPVGLPSLVDVTTQVSEVGWHVHTVEADTVVDAHPGPQLDLVLDRVRGRYADSRSKA